MCEVDPQNVGMLRTFGAVLLAGFGLSLLTGTSYFRGFIAKAESPADYWMATASLGSLGAFVTIGTYVC